MNPSAGEEQNHSVAPQKRGLSVGERRFVSVLGILWTLYFGYRLTYSFCICPGEGLAMCAAAAFPVIFGPKFLRALGVLLLALSIYTTWDMVRAKAAQDEAVKEQVQEYLKQHQHR